MNNSEFENTYMIFWMLFLLICAIFCEKTDQLLLLLPKCNKIIHTGNIYLSSFSKEQFGAFYLHLLCTPNLKFLNVHFKVVSGFFSSLLGGLDGLILLSFNFVLLCSLTWNCSAVLILLEVLWRTTLVTYYHHCIYQVRWPEWPLLSDLNRKFFVDFNPLRWAFCTMKQVKDLIPSWFMYQDHPLLPLHKREWRGINVMNIWVRRPNRQQGLIKSQLLLMQLFCFKFALWIWIVWNE